MNIKQHIDIPFTQVANTVLNDTRLTLKAKGLYAYLYSKPQSWNFSLERIALDTNDGKKAIASAMHELEKTGYLMRERQQNLRILYTLSFGDTVSCSAVSSCTQNGSETKRLRDKRATVSNTELNKHSILSNKDSTHATSSKNPETLPSQDDGGIEIEKIENIEHKPTNAINDILSLFQMQLNENINFGNKTQRGAVQSLLDKHGMERLIKIIKYCISIKDEPFSPTITTPLQLWEKEAQIASFYNKQQKTQKSNLFIIS